jgi:hypothetical protein
MRAKEFIREAENTNLKQELQKDWMPQGYVTPQEFRGKNISLPRDEKGHPIEPGLAQPLISPEDLVLPLAGSLSRKVTQGIGGLARGATKSTSGITSTASSAVPQTSLDLAQKAELAAKYPWQQRTKFSNLPPEGPFSQQTYQDAMRRAWQQTPPTQGPFDTFKDLVKAPKINIGDVTLPNPLGARNIGRQSLSAERLAQNEFKRLYGRSGSARDLEDATKLDALRDRFVGRGYQSLPPRRTDFDFPTDLPKLDPGVVRSRPLSPDQVKRELKKQIDRVGQDAIPALGVDTTRLAADYAKNWSAANKDKQTKNQ